MYEYHYFNELNPADYPQYKQPTIEAEQQDTAIVERLMFDELNSNPLYMSVTAIRKSLYSSVDLEYSVNTTTGHTLTFGVEVKRRNKDRQSMERWPYMPLRLSKWEALRYVANQRRYDAMYYVGLLNNEEAHIWDISRVDWTKVELQPWRVNIDEQRPHLGMQQEYVYFLPLYDFSQPLKIREITPYTNAHDNQTEA